MNILFDLITTQYYPNMKYHGGGEYVKKIFFKLIEREVVNNLYFILSEKMEIADGIKNKLKDKKVFYIEEGIEKIIIENKINRFYIGTIGNYLNVYFPKNLELIVTIHDLRTLETVYDNLTPFYKLNTQHKLFSILYRIAKNNFYLEKQIEKLRKKLYLKKFSNFYKHENLKIITVSKHSKNMLKTQLNFLQNKEIEVFYSPEKEIIKNIPENKNIFFYILLVSSNRMEKNNIRALVALDELISDGLYKEKIIITGGLKLKKGF